MLSSFIFIIVGIFIGQEYNVYLPNVRALTLQLLSNMKEYIDKENNNKNNKIDFETEHKNIFYNFIKKFI
jgi:hypothetical protein